MTDDSLLGERQDGDEDEADDVRATVTGERDRDRSRSRGSGSEGDGNEDVVHTDVDGSSTDHTDVAGSSTDHTDAAGSSTDHTDVAGSDGGHTGPDASAVENDATERGERETVLTSSTVGLDVPSEATPEETAAIVTAIRVHLDALERAGNEDGDDESSTTDRWTVSGRLSELTNRPVWLPRTAPADPWTGSGRTDRM